MKLLKSLALLVCMQITTVFGMEGTAIQEIEEDQEARSAAELNTGAFLLWDHLKGKLNKQKSEERPLFCGMIDSQMVGL